jgi:hypothetical protein
MERRDAGTQRKTAKSAEKGLRVAIKLPQSRFATVILAFDFLCVSAPLR